ncbi:MAG: hypothetical protein WCW36_01175 [Candidatus Paceibacterota bacterium]|jgi:hypothetical protein
MALLPTIPTSFVPHATLSDNRHVRTDFGNAFGFSAYIILGISFVLALGVFFYGRILAVDLAAKDAALVKAEAAIDQDTVKGFVQLRDRLNASQALLESHIALSGFFSVLETTLPATVRFSTLHISIDDAGTATVEGAGVSKSFNALSVASAAFAADGRIKDVIFSNMSINKNSSVSFDFSATLDPKLLVFSPSAKAEAPIIPTNASSSSATTTPL